MVSTAFIIVATPFFANGMWPGANWLRHLGEKGTFRTPIPPNGSRDVPEPTNARNPGRKFPAEPEDRNGGPNGQVLSSCFSADFAKFGFWDFGSLPVYDFIDNLRQSMIS